MAGEADVEYFARLIEALDPWLDRVVIIGGWAHRLYRLHPLAQSLDYEPLGTLDTDVAVPLILPATGEQLHTRLLAKGFREELMGNTQPPAAHYCVSNGDSSFYAEFLTPLEGGGIKRGGRRDITARVSGVSVQKLRHLELMLQNPWGVMITPAMGYRSMLDACGAPIGVQQKLMRHAQVSTTMKYGNAYMTEKRKAHGAVVQMVLPAPRKEKAETLEASA